MIISILLASTFILAITAPVSIVLADGEEGEETEEEHQGYFPLKPPEDPVTGTIDVPQTVGETGIKRAANLAASILENARLILAAVAIGALILSGFFLITAQGNEEELTKQKTNLQWWGIGLLIILLMKPFLQIFDVAEGGIFADPEYVVDRVKIFDQSTTIVITYIKYILGGIAIVYIVRSCYYLITYGDQEETVTKEKKNIFAAAIGLVLVTLADMYVNKFLFIVDKDPSSSAAAVNPAIDARRGMVELIGMTNFLVTFAGPLAMLLLVVGAIMYVTAQGEEDQMNKAKSLIKNTVIGLIIIYGTYGLVTTFITGSISGTSPT